VALDPIYVRWLNKPVRVQHDDPRQSRSSDVVQRLQAAMLITTEVATLRMIMAVERGYDVQVLDDGSEVRLRRRDLEPRTEDRRRHYRDGEGDDDE
jgi:hypothetical protein